MSVTPTAQKITIKCSFMNHSMNSNKYCGAVYGPNCENITSSATDSSATTNNSNYLTIELDYKINHTANMCLIVTAKNDSKIIHIEHILLMVSGKLLLLL